MRKMVALILSCFLLTPLHLMAKSIEQNQNDEDFLLSLNAKKSLIEFCFKNKLFCKMDSTELIGASKKDVFDSVLFKKKHDDGTLVLIQLTSNYGQFKGRAWGVVLYQRAGETYHLFTGENVSHDQQKEFFDKGELIDESFDMSLFCPQDLSYEEQ